MARFAVAILLVVLPLMALASPSRADDWPGRPVVVIGVDGATWDVIDPMMARGELPNFLRLVERGARTDLIVLPPLRSPVVWTTYATGTFGRQHEILDFTFPYVSGVPKVPVRSTQRRVPAIWNVATDVGRSVGLVGYFVTNPAEIVDGFVVSDVKLQSRGGSTYPAELVESLELISTGQQMREGFDKFLPWKYDPSDAENADSPYHQASRIVRHRVDTAIVFDENVRSTALKLQPRGVDLFMTYFRIVDQASHAAWLYYDDSDFETKPRPAEKKLLADLIPAAYRYVDAFIGELLALVGEEANIVVVSDHGFGSATGPYVFPEGAFEGLLTGNHRHDGILVAAGPDIRHGSFEHVSHMDVTPLLLALIGAPVSDELPGRVPVELLEASFLEKSPPRSTSRYALGSDHVETPPMDAEAVDETLQQLKSLGYIDDSTTAGQGATVDEFDFWSVDKELYVPVVQGEILFHVMRGDPDEVDRLMRLAVEHEVGRFFPAFVHDAFEEVQSRFSFEVFPEDGVRRFEESYMPKPGARASGSLVLALGAGMLGWLVWRAIRHRRT